MKQRFLSAWCLILALVLSLGAVSAPALAEETTAEATSILSPFLTTDVSTMSGFSFQLITDEGFTYGKTDNGFATAKTDSTTGNTIYTRFSLMTLHSFWENRDNALYLYDLLPGQLKYREPDATEDVDIDGHPARILYFTTKDENRQISIGTLLYVRNNIVLEAQVSAISPEGSEHPLKISRAEMDTVIAGIRYDEEQAPIRQADGEITLETKEKTNLISAGRKLNFTAAFAHADLAKDKTMNVLVWSVADAATGEAPQGITISDKGVLATDRNIDHVTEVTVKAESTIFQSRAESTVTVLPVVKKITLNPGEVSLYAGSEQTVTVQPVIDPETVPTKYLSWKAGKEGIAEVTISEDGTATLKALAAGNTQIAVSEPGGKKAVLKVRVMEPVASVTLALNGKPTAGKGVNVKAVIEPKNAGNKTLAWSLNVDESIATVTKNGTVKIAKDVPAGTVITVTCTASGAPEPIEATLDLTVE